MMDINKLSYNKERIENIKVGIIDTGFDFDTPLINLHPVHNIEHSSTTEPGHGQSIAVLIGGRYNSTTEFRGLIPGIKLYAYEIDQNELTTSSLTNAILEMEMQGIDIISISLGTYHSSESLHKAAKKLVENGGVIIASAGNYSSMTYNYPASLELDGVISVGALDRKGTVLPYTTVNDRIDVYAPGDQIYIPSNFGNDLEPISGTSISTVFVTTLATLLKSKCPYLKPDEIEMHIKNNAKNFLTRWKHREVNVSLISFQQTLDKSCE